MNIEIVTEMKSKKYPNVLLELTLRNIRSRIIKEIIEIIEKDMIKIETAKIFAPTKISKGPIAIPKNKITHFN